MSPKNNFLCEIGTEEIPAGYFPPAIKEIENFISQKLEEERINFGKIKVYATPRRFAILIANLALSQESKEIELKGPSLQAAYDSEQNPSKALLGFLKGNNINQKDIFTQKTEKGEYIFGKKKLSSLKTAVIIPKLIETLIEKISFPKRMRWSDKQLTFPRPISYLLLLFNDKIIPLNIDGIKASNKTRGHYIQFNRMIKIDKIADYEKILKKNAVIVNHLKRREIIEKKLLVAAQKLKGVLDKDENLLNTVTFLVENPHLIVGQFEPKFLELPDIALVAEMKEHQKYFPVLDEDNKLTSNFLVISNNPKTTFIKKGNQKVISARFNDARFFYNEDHKLKLIDRVDSLKNVTFHKDLGSIYNKIERMLLISGTLGEILNLPEQVQQDIQKAIKLSKTDLITAMVIEFPSLQGKIGKIYALEDGEKAEVAQAIEDHYKPNFYGEKLPTKIISIITSLAEKLDNLLGSYSVGNIPKGSQDPYALRRQANALIEILIQNKINLSLNALLKKISGQYHNGSVLIDDLLNFIKARAKTIFLENNFKHDEIEACFSTQNTDFYELYQVTQSLNQFRQKENFTEMLVSFKRINNITSAFRKKNPSYQLNFQEALLKDKEEKDLYNFLKQKEESIKQHLKKSRYLDLFNILIQSKIVIDPFFEKILVMDENIQLRDNRLYLLESILHKFSSFIDFSKIAE